MIHEWILTMILAIAFYGAGGTKLAGAKVQMENFVRWKYPPWPSRPLRWRGRAA